MTAFNTGRFYVLRCGISILESFTSWTGSFQAEHIPIWPPGDILSTTLSSDVRRKEMTPDGKRWRQTERVVVPQGPGYGMQYTTTRHSRQQQSAAADTKWVWCFIHSGFWLFLPLNPRWWHGCCPKSTLYTTEIVCHHYSGAVYFIIHNEIKNKTKNEQKIVCWRLKQDPNT